MNKITSYIRSAAVLLAMSVCWTGCVDEHMQDNHEQRTPICLGGEIQQQHVSRVNDSGFATGDQVGIFVVNYANGVPSTLGNVGNHADNVCFTYDEETGTMTGATQLYWKDDVTPADFYGYYPFDDHIKSVAAYPFAVQRNQRDQVSGESIYGYEASDFLWVKAEGITPTTAVVKLPFKHRMAGIQVNLEEGTGFGEGQWADAEKQVLVESTRLGSTISLQTGAVTVDAQSAVASIIPQGSGNSYRAIVVPQTIEKGATLFSITIDGKTYKFTRAEAMVYNPMKLHKFTIVVNYSASTGDCQLKLQNEAIVAWESDAVSHNGTAREYITVHVDEGEYIGDVISEMGIDPKEIINLKLTGTLSEHDHFRYIRENMPDLQAVNMRDLRTKNQRSFYWEGNGTEGDGWGVPPYEQPMYADDYIPMDAFKQMKFLSYVVWPEHLKGIGDGAFAGCNLRGSLIFPEGLKHIGGSVFEGYSLQISALSGEIYIPSTVEYIGGNAFGGFDGWGTNLSGELVLPAKMKYLGPAFNCCQHLTGKIQIPEGLTVVEGAFAPNMTGDVRIPQGVKRINGIGGKPTSIYIPEGVEEIGSQAFLWVGSLKGDIHLPSTIRKIGADAFAATSISHIHLPEGLEIIEDNTFGYCESLIDTITIPSTVTQIKRRAFAECKQLTAVVLSENLQEIQGEAFVNCHSLDYIRCLNPEPPMLDQSAFNGVEKNNFTLVVPEGAVEAYRNAEGWKEFKRISAYRNFVCRPMFANLLNKSNTRTIILNADGNWEVTHCPDWAHLSKTEGYKKTELTVTIDQLARGAGNRNDSIVFTLTNQVDEEGKSITCSYDICQYDSEYDEDSQIQLQQATKGKGINLVFIGDGYDAADIASGQCLADFKEGMEYFFAVEPFKTYKNYFNVYAQFPLSYESGVCSHVNIWRDTKFDSTYGKRDGRLWVDFESMMGYVLNDVEGGAITEQNVNESVIITILNSDAYEGLTSMWSTGAAIAAVPHSRLEYPNDFRGLIQHEACGHAFAKLGDEYIYHRNSIYACPCTCCQHADELLMHHGLGWSRNLSLTGKYKQIEWTHLIFDDRYQDIVDIYEGGFFHGKGVYRSEVNSCMNNNVPYFSTWSRQIAVERIKSLAGEKFDFEDFVANDSREWGDKFLTRSGGGMATSVMHNPAPIVKQGSPLDNVKK